MSDLSVTGEQRAGNREVQRKEQNAKHEAWGPCFSTLGLLPLLPARILLLAAVLIAPWLYGSVHEWSQVWLFLLLAPAVAYTFVLQLFHKGAAGQLSLTMVILLLALGWGAIQLVPLPQPLSEFASPEAARLRAQLLPDESSPDADLGEKLDVAIGGSSHTISLRPDSTRYDLALLALGVSAFYLAAQLFSSTKSQIWLYSLVAANGACLAFFGLVQRMTWNGQLFWIGRFPGGGSPFASFVSRNSAGGYLNMCLAAALALAIWPLVRRLPTGMSAAEKGSGTNCAKHPQGRSGNWFLTPFLDLDAAKLLGIALPALLFGGILCTASRGAVVSAFAASILTAPALIWFGRWRFRVVLILVVGLLGVGLVGWAGMQDLVQHRLGTLTDSEELSTEGRLLHWGDSIRAAPDFWRTGSGLGTYRDLYLLYERHRFSSLFYHAENQYLEALVEGGAVGLLLLLSAIVSVALANLRMLASAKSSPAHLACGIAGLFALLTQVVHSFFDFSLYLPANMLLLAAICGATTSLAKERRAEKRKRRTAAKRQRKQSREFAALQLGNRKSKIGNVLVSLVLLLCLVAGWFEVRQLTDVKQARRDADFTIHPRGATQAQLLAAIRNLEPLLRDDDAESHYVMAELRTHLYRLQALEKLREESPSNVSLDELWEQTSPESVHRQAQQSDEVPMPKLAQEQLIPALKHLVKARSAGPLLSKVHLRIAPLSVLVSGPGADEVHLDRACSVRPSSAYTLNKVARLDLQAGRNQAAYRRFRKCLEISPSYLPEVLEFCGPQVPFSEIVSQALPQSPKFLLDMAAQRPGGSDAAEQRTLLVERALELLRNSDAPEAERQHLVGRGLALLGRYPEALRAYLYAVQERPNVASWRYELSVLLLHEGHVDEAVEQAQASLRLAPDNADYQRHLQQAKRKRFVSDEH